MKTATNLKWALALPALIISFSAQATLVVTFEFTNSLQNVEAFDTVIMNGRLTNTSASNENLTYSSFAAGLSTYGNLSPYSITYGLAGNLWGQFSGLNLAPNSSFDFVYGSLTPGSVPVPDGTYGPITAAFAYFDSSRSNMLQTNYSDFSFTVGSPVSAVPEPETYSMLLIGLGLIGFIARRKNRNGAMDFA